MKALRRRVWVFAAWRLRCAPAPNWRYYSEFGSTLRDLLRPPRLLQAAGDVDLAHGFNGELAEVVANAPDRLAYGVPKEGGTLWIDSVAIPKTARNVDAAYALLEYVLVPATAARIVNGVHDAGANRAALPLIDPKIRQDPSIYPPKEVLDRCELLEDLGETTTLIDELLTEVKAQ